MTENLQHYRDKLRCSVTQVDDIFAGCMDEARQVLSERGIDDYLDAASIICNLGRGTELVLIFLEGAPTIAKYCGESVIPEISRMCQMLSRTANGKAINPFLSTLPSIARRLEDVELMRDYFMLIERMATEGKEGLVGLLEQVEHILHQISIGGLKNWIDYGLRVYHGQSHKMPEFFGLKTPDSHAALQRERHGSLFVDHERRLTMYLGSFWGLELDCHPFSLAFATLRKPRPFIDRQGFHVPDVFDDFNGVRGIDLYRALLAHMAAHKLYTKPFLADNYSQFQQLFVETFEDSRVEALVMRQYPGLRRLFMALHPTPEENACPENHSPVRHKLAMLSRALLDPQHPYRDPVLLELVAEFHKRVAADPHDTKIATDLGVEYMARIHTPAFRQPKIWFKDTEVPYRDDNRYLWFFLEDTDDEDDFTSDHSAANPRERETEGVVFSRHHQEWDYQLQLHRPDWTTVYESVHPAGAARDIDRLLEKNKRLSKQLQRIIDLLKPQQHVRIRYQEDGSELDLDIAVRAMIEQRSGITPDPRINMSHKTDGRDIAVTLLLDLSESINETPPGCNSSIRELSQEAVSLLGWAIEQLGDPFAIAGFASNTRLEVRYLHFKGFDEPWSDTVKARLAAMTGGYSTRMGAAVRHASYYLGHRPNSKKLLLILTDGEPADIDVTDPLHLRADTKKAVEEAHAAGIHTYCISLDPRADEYVADIFGNSYAVIDHVEKLPEQLTRLFVALTK